MSDNPLSKIKHVVVLMLENRSFDNLFGYLYDPQNDAPFDKPPRNQSFEGVSGKDLTNPIPGGGVAHIGECTDFTAPQPNPNEAYADVYGQIYNDNPHPEVIPNPAKPPRILTPFFRWNVEKRSVPPVGLYVPVATYISCSGTA